MLKLPALRINQSGEVLYLTKMTAGQMIDTCTTTEWDPNYGWDVERQGYQRTPVRKHFVGIGNFLFTDANPFMPTSALLAAREDQYGTLEFQEQIGNDDFSFGYLRVPSQRKLYIVDYQHRWRGFMYAIEERGKQELNDFVIPVIIMARVASYEEIKQFYLINSKQRRVDTDLALTLLQTMATQATEQELVNLVGPGKRYRIRATRLTFAIAQRPDGPWAGRIQPPHDEIGDAVLSIKSMADSLRPIVSSRSPISHLADGQVIDIVVDFWSALERLIPDAFRTPRNYSIQKTPGVFSLHIVAAKQVLPICRSKNDYSSESISNILRHAETYMRGDFWATNGPVKMYGGSGGHRSLAEEIMEQIRRNLEDLEKE